MFALCRALAFLGLLFCGQAEADIPVQLDGAPGVVLLPDNWRPIPRAEIVEARDRVSRAMPGAAPPLPVAAFQRLPTLQWFSLPHALVFWHAGAAPDASAGDGRFEQAAPDLKLSENLGRGPGGPIHAWRCLVLRADGHFSIDLLTTDDDGRALILGLAEGLRLQPVGTGSANGSSGRGE